MRPLTPGEEATMRAHLERRMPIGPGLTVEGAQRLFATLDRERAQLRKAIRFMQGHLLGALARRPGSYRCSDARCGTRRAQARPERRRDSRESNERATRSGRRTAGVVRAMVTFDKRPHVPERSGGVRQCASCGMRETWEGWADSCPMPRSADKAAEAARIRAHHRNTYEAKKASRAARRAFLRGETETCDQASESRQSQPSASE